MEARVRDIRAWIDANQVPTRVLLVLFFIVGGSISATVVEPSGSERPTDWLAYALIAAASLPVWWYRTRPLVALPACAFFLVTYWVLDYTGSAEPALWLLFYSATRYGNADRRNVWRVVLATLALVMTVAFIGVLIPEESLPGIALLGLLVIHLVPAAIGEALYQRHQHIEQLKQRATMLEAELETKAALAAVEERSRIAREMHDIIAHGMSTIVVQAQGAQRIVDSDPDKAKEVLGTIEHIGRDSVNEMRRMLGVLRSDQDGEGEAARTPQPSLSDLTPLISQAEQSGIEVAVDITGQVRELLPGLELAGYRIVQEALTNVIRHAGRPARAEVHVHYGVNTLEVGVSDDGLGAAANGDTVGTGHGLVGMRERVEIYNGDFSAGPQPGGGYAVQVSMPVIEQVRA